ncbi:MAG: hypothetical protein KGJ80_12425 [Chloroflexota bacterium]|nr:hypothetical protein [Chloroflexota bacterium]
MTWRNWSIIVVLLLANYLVFSALAVVVFPPKTVIPPTHVVQPTFTPGAPPLQRVDPLNYDFLTPSPTATISPTATLTPTRRP